MYITFEAFTDLCVRIDVYMNIQNVMTTQTYLYDCITEPLVQSSICTPYFIWVQ